MGKLKIQIKTIFGKLIFESEKENNSISEAIKDYIKQELEKGNSSADLSSADLSSADLSSANLSSADLRFANLRFANLSFANLSFANLSSANLISADLSSADLSSAALDKRYISVSCIGSSKRMTTYCFEDDIIWCGCFKGSLADFEKQVKKTHKNNEKYLKEYLGFINYLKTLID